MHKVDYYLEQEWREHSHAIVKYRPEFYNEDGVYTKNEWRGIEDVGRIYDGKIVTLAEYFETEQKYVDAVVELMNMTNSCYLTVAHLGDSIRSTKCSISKILNPDNRFSTYDKLLYNTYIKLIEGQRIHINNIGNVVRLNLREYTYTDLINEQNHLEIHFGYDYYMYCNSDVSKKKLRKRIEEIGLFLDPMDKDDYV